MGYSVSTLVDKLEISAHTLRYYEKEGLIPPVARMDNGHRAYSEEDLNWIRLVQCLRKTGMSVALIKEYIALENAGDETFEQRKTLVLQQKRLIEGKISEMQSVLEIINLKAGYFEKSE